MSDLRERLEAAKEFCRNRGEGAFIRGTDEWREECEKHTATITEAIEHPERLCADGALIVEPTASLPSATGATYEFADGDKLAEALGVLRTEGGHLNVRKMIASIRDGQAAVEVLRDWLKARSRFTSLEDERKQMPDLEARAQKIVDGAYVPAAPSPRVEVGHIERANVDLAAESALLRFLLSSLVQAVDNTKDLDEMDGPEFQEASDGLDAIMTVARPHTEQALLEKHGLFYMKTLPGGSPGDSHTT